MNGHSDERLTQKYSLLFFASSLPRDKKEMRAFHAWFTASVEAHCRLAERRIRLQAGYEHWCVNYDAASVVGLQNALWSMATLRPRRSSDVLRMTAPDGMEVVIDDPAGVYLSDESCVDAFAVGVYIGECFRRTYPALRWRCDKSLGTVARQLSIVPFKDKTEFEPCMLAYAWMLEGKRASPNQEMFIRILKTRMWWASQS